VLLWSFVLTMVVVIESKNKKVGMEEKLVLWYHDNRIVKWHDFIKCITQVYIQQRKNMLTEWLTNCMYILVAYIHGSVTDLCSVCYTVMHYWFSVSIMACLLWPCMNLQAVVIDFDLEIFGQGRCIIQSWVSLLYSNDNIWEVILIFKCPHGTLICFDKCTMSIIFRSFRESWIILLKSMKKN
jgi:hypothetical protein